MAKNDLTGHTLGQYTIISRLGRGGMADVYKAFHPKLEVYRAVKVIRPELVTASDFQERFQKEAQSVASLRHSNIVRIHDFGEQDDTYFMVMEFIEGQDLKRIIKSEGRIRPIRRPLELISQVADALHYAHSRGLIHRDIKPENIMIDEDGLPILMDFGIAKLLTANTQLTQTGMGIGTPAYMAPEQAQALPEIGPTADIYSLSVVLYEMLTGQVPFSADTPMAVMLKAINDPAPMPRLFSGDISDNLQQVLLKGMAKDPENRYTTARQFQKALQEVIDETPESSEEPAATALMQSGETGLPGDSELPETRQRTKASEQATKLRREERHGSRRPGLVAALVVMALLLVGGAGAGIYFYLQPDGLAQIADFDGRGSEEDPRIGGAEPGDQPDSGEPAEFAGPESEEDPRLGVAEPGDRPETGETAESAGPESEEYPRLGVAEPGDRPGPGEAAEESSTRADPDADTAAGSEPAAEPRTADVEVDESTEQQRQTIPPASVDPAGEPEPTVSKGGAIAMGETVREEVAGPMEKWTYTLDAAAGTTIFFDHEGEEGAFDFTLTAPDDRTEVFTTGGDHGPVSLEENGGYTLVADPRGGSASYEFTVHELDPPVIDGGAIALDRRSNGKTELPGQRVTYTLDVDPGQAVQFDLASATAATDFTLTSPDGGSRVFTTQGNHGPVTLERGGAYTLEARPRGDRTAEFAFAVKSWQPPMTDGGALRLGNLVREEIPVRGRAVAYSIDVQAGQTIFFDHVDNQRRARRVDFRLMAPDGRTRVFETQGDHGPVTLENPGTYTLVADPRDERVAGYEFVVWNVNPAEVDGGMIQIDRQVEGQTSVPGQSVNYRFRANPGQVIHFEHVESTQPTEFTLTAPDGTQVFRTQGDFGPHTLEQGGTYSLSASPRGDWVSKFKFVVLRGGAG